MENDVLSKSNRLRLAIGDVVIAFQFMEHELASIICSMLQLKEAKDVQRISSAMSFKQKVDLFCEIYPTRRNASWPEIDVKAVKNALSTAEEFRNSIVHSFWYVSGSKRIVWMRSKGSMRSSSGLIHVDGVANISAMEKGVVAMGKIRNWYVGDTIELKAATAKIKVQLKSLTRKISG
jgi:hypothetical protein